MHKTRYTILSIVRIVAVSALPAILFSLCLSARAAFAGDPTAAVIVTESYDVAVFTKLPYGKAAEAFLKQAGYTIVDEPLANPDLLLKIHATGKALSETYFAKSPGYDRTRKIRKGVRLFGTIVLRFGDQAVPILKEFSAEKSGPESARETDANPYRAPFRELFRETYLHELSLLMYEQFGAGTVIGALAADNAEARYSAAYALGYTKEPAAVKPLIDRVGDSSGLVRRQVAIALGELGDTRAVEPMIPLLQDREPEVRRQAQDVLFAMDDPRSAKPLIDSFARDLKHKDVLVRLLAVDRLGHFHDPGVIPPLSEALEDPDERVRLAAARSLRRVSTGPAADTLIDALEKKENQADTALRDVSASRELSSMIAALKDEDPKVRESAARALGDLKNPGIVHPLALAVADDHPRVARQARRSLSRALTMSMQIGIHDLSEVLNLDDASLQERSAELLEKRNLAAIGVLQNTLSRGNACAREYSARALGNLESKSSLEILILALRDPEPKVRAEAALALGKINDPRAVGPLLEKVSDDGSFGVRSASREALSAFSAAATAPDFLSRLEDSKRRVRNTCRKALLGIRDPEVVPLYIQSLRRGSSFAKKTLADALGAIGDSRAIIPMLPLLSDSSYWVRDHSFKAVRDIIEGMNDPRDIEPLIAALDAKNGSVRNAARKKLGRLNELALGALEAPSPSPPDDSTTVEEKQEPTIPRVTFRRQMLQSLIAIGDPRAVETLIRGLSDPDAVYRRLSAQGLGNFQDLSAVDPLIHALEDEDPDVRASAQRSLKDLTGQQLGPEPAPWHAWWNKNKPKKAD